MATGYATYIKKINRSLIVSKIIEHEMISRADLSKLTNLTRATLSVQAASLLEEGLIVESHQEHHNVGRKPIMLSLNRKAGYALGIDIEYKHILFTISDLLGFPIHSDTVIIKDSDYDSILNLLITQIKTYEDTYSDCQFGIVGVGIAIHGIVANDQSINYVPQHQWRNKDLKGDLEKIFTMEISVENNANLCAFSEKVFKHHHCENLLSISLYSGIGLGVLINGEPLKGFHGFAGEMGHMIIVPNGKRCNCGNLGCWELYASEKSFFNQLMETLQRDVITYDDIQELVKENDSATLKLMDQFLNDLAIGLNNIINLLNPETVVLNSELLKLFPNASDKLRSRLTSSISHYKELIISDLGKHAAVMGAYASVIKKFLEVPDLSIKVNDEQINSIPIHHTEQYVI
jgi:predicted NBD/HSP70 family sugar kinase